MEKQGFIVGQWYLSDSEQFYGKYLEPHKNNLFGAKEWIDINEERYEINSNLLHCNVKNYTPISLDIIRKYLPEDHIDQKPNDLFIQLI